MHMVITPQVHLALVGGIMSLVKLQMLLPAPGKIFCCDPSQNWCIAATKAHTRKT